MIAIHLLPISLAKTGLAVQLVSKPLALREVTRAATRDERVIRDEPAAANQQQVREPQQREEPEAANYGSGAGSPPNSPPR